MPAYLVNSDMTNLKNAKKSVQKELAKLSKTIFRLIYHASTKIKQFWEIQKETKLGKKVNNLE